MPKYYVQKMETEDPSKIFFIQRDELSFTTDPCKAKNFTASEAFLWLEGNPGFTAWPKLYIDSIKVSYVSPDKADTREAFNVSPGIKKRL